MDTLPAQGIDALRMDFLPLEESDNGLCDRALVHAAHFKDLKMISVATSDTTDAGLENLKTLPKLQVILAQEHWLKENA